MIRSIFAQKDATVYNLSSSMNTGRDEILEVSKTIPFSGSAPALARSLVKFDLNRLNTGLSGSSYNRQFVLRLWATEPDGLQPEYTLAVYPVSQSWTMGVGKYFNTPPTTEGVSWDYRTGKLSQDYWESGSSGGPTIFSGQYTITQSSDPSNVTPSPCHLVTLSPLHPLSPLGAPPHG